MFRIGQSNGTLNLTLTSRYTSTLPKRQKKTLLSVVMINNNMIPNAKATKYLGITSDIKSKWIEHVKKKHE